MSPSTADTSAATAADARRRQRSARHRSAATAAEAVSDASAQPTQGGPASDPHPAVPSSAPWPDSVANPRRTRVR